MRRPLWPLVPDPVEAADGARRAAGSAGSECDTQRGCLPGGQSQSGSDTAGGEDDAEIVTFDFPLFVIGTF